MAASKTDIWMPFYIGDYLRDTLRLSTRQHGAYFLLLIECWRSDSPLPDDDEQLAAITKLSLKDWKKDRQVIQPFFIVSADGWQNKRLNEEKEKSEARRKAAQENGKKGGRGKSKQKPTEKL